MWSLSLQYNTVSQWHSLKLSTPSERLSFKSWNVHNICSFVNSKNKKQTKKKPSSLLHKYINLSVWTLWTWLLRENEIDWNILLLIIFVLQKLLDELIAIFLSLQKCFNVLCCDLIPWQCDSLEWQNENSPCRQFIYVETCLVLNGLITACLSLVASRFLLSSSLCIFNYV